MTASASTSPRRAAKNSSSSTLFSTPLLLFLFSLIFFLVLADLLFGFSTANPLNPPGPSAPALRLDPSFLPKPLAQAYEAGAANSPAPPKTLWRPGASSLPFEGLEGRDVLYLSYALFSPFLLALVCLLAVFGEKERPRSRQDRFVPWKLLFGLLGAFGLPRLLLLALSFATGRLGPLSQAVFWNPSPIFLEALDALPPQTPRFFAQGSRPFGVALAFLSLYEAFQILSWVALGTLLHHKTRHPLLRFFIPLFSLWGAELFWVNSKSAWLVFFFPAVQNPWRDTLGSASLGLGYPLVRGVPRDYGLAIFALGAWAFLFFWLAARKTPPPALLKEDLQHAND
ncbi:hypothetical protein ABB02_00116 [Clostridiaceae bacterium JG1575]|nr:hypothetical protein ABB02_00116 [Clostridiaceae bacterium JG1575]